MDRVEDEKNIGFVNENEGESERESKNNRVEGTFNKDGFYKTVLRQFSRNHLR